MSTPRPKIVVSRAVFPETIARLAQHFEVLANQDDVIWSREQLIANLQAWCLRAEESGIEALREFSLRLRAVRV